jgi:hypothetical protein
VTVIHDSEIISMFFTLLNIRLFNFSFKVVSVILANRLAFSIFQSLNTSACEQDGVSQSSSGNDNGKIEAQSGLL